MSRVFLVPRTGDGSSVARMFAPAVMPQDGKPFSCYMSGTLFLVVTEAELTGPDVVELTGADIDAAATTFAIPRSALPGGAS